MVEKKDLMEFAIGRADHEHAELTEAWKLLDTKSQATTAIAGVFLAATFVFVRNTAFSMTGFERLLLGLAVLSLVASIICAIQAMRVKDVPMPFTGEETLSEVTAIVKKHTLPESLSDRYIGLLGDCINAWIKVNNTIRTELNIKSSWLTWSHKLLLVTSFFILLLTGVALLHGQACKV